MSLSLCTHPRDDAPQRSDSSIRAGRTTATVAAAALVVVTLAYSWVKDVSFGIPLSSEVAVAVAAIAVLAGLVMLLRGRAGQVRRRRRGTDECLDWIDQLHVTRSLGAVPDPSAPPAGTHADASAVPEAPHVRALRMQVRALERALEEQVAQARHEPEQPKPEQEPRRDLDRVLVTMGALRDQLRGDAGAGHVLDRVEAAVTRLGGSRVPGRPVITPATIAPAMATATATATATVAPGTHMALPEATTPPSPAPETSVAAVEPEVEPTPPPADVQPVLPVPAPTPQSVSRGKSWRRRRVA
jgi:hypothetical protein